MARLHIVLGLFTHISGGLGCLYEHNAELSGSLPCYVCVCVDAKGAIAFQFQSINRIMA